MDSTPKQRATDPLLPLSSAVPLYVRLELSSCLFWKWVDLAQRFQTALRRAPVERRN